MLNYKELSSKFTEILSSFSANDLQEWIEFDSQREALERLTNGESVIMSFADFSFSGLSDIQENIIVTQESGNTQHAMAA